MDRKRRTLSTLLTDSNQTLYSVPVNFETDVKNIILSNKSDSVRYVTIERYDLVEDTWYSFCGELPLSGNSIVKIDEPLFMKKGDSLRGLASSNDSVTVHIVVNEVFYPK